MHISELQKFPFLNYDKVVTHIQVSNIVFHESELQNHTYPYNEQQQSARIWDMSALKEYMHIKVYYDKRRHVHRNTNLASLIKIGLITITRRNNFYFHTHNWKTWPLKNKYKQTQLQKQILNLTQFSMILKLKEALFPLNDHSFSLHNLLLQLYSQQLKKWHPLTVYVTRGYR